MKSKKPTKQDAYAAIEQTVRRLKVILARQQKRNEELAQKATK